MVLTKDELIHALQNEIRILLHLASKVDAANLHFRPAPKQRSIMELLQYLTIMGPIHLRGTITGVTGLDAWGQIWNREEAAAQALDLQQVKDSIARQPALFADLLEPCSDAALREEIEMFGQKASRGSFIVSLVLCHYAAYRMQLFQYLKGSGCEGLNTMNLWVGIDASMSRPAQ